MTGQQLKNSILQLAIQGKLVPQDPNDEPASVLLQRIRKEKEQLVKDGKLKKKDLISEPITEDEKPFDIPESWEWVRVQQISDSYIGLTYSPTEVSDLGTVVLRSSNIKDGKINLSEIVRVNKLIPEKLIVHENDILICARNGSKKLVGKSAIITKEADGMTFGAFMAICRTPFFRYVYSFLQSDAFYSQLREVSGTTTINQLTQKNFSCFVLPLPPLAEQQRIVAKIEELMPLVEDYDKAQKELNDLNEKLPEQLKKSILQQAIMGKLVPQDPADEPASVLLQRIRKEKEQLVKEGKIKLSKPENGVKAFESTTLNVPNSWVVCQLVDVCRAFGRIGFRGYTKEDLVNDPCKGAISLSPSNMKDYGMEYSDCTYITWEKYEESPEIQINNGDILIVKTGSSYGKTVLVEDLPHKATINPQIAVIKNIQINSKYLLYYLQAPLAREKYEEFVLGTSIPTFSQQNLLGMEFPLPPLAEQQRIVAKIEELFAQLDKIEKGFS